MRRRWRARSVTARGGHVVVSNGQPRRHREPRIPMARYAWSEHGGGLWRLNSHRGEELVRRNWVLVVRVWVCGGLRREGLGHIWRPQY